MPRRVVVQKRQGVGRRRPASGVRPKSAKRSTEYDQAYDNVNMTVSGPFIRSEEVHEYIQNVKQAFKKHPEVYKQFVSVLGAVQNPGGSNVLDIIDEIANLFEGHPDLILGFNSFLPNNYEIQVQKDAVVVKVYEKSDDGAFWDAKSRVRQENSSVDYIQEVKNTLAYDPAKYGEFMDILSEFHSKKIKEIVAIKKVVRVLVDHPHLVLGFNDFLPDDYHIHMYSENSYTIKHPGAKGKTATITINLI